MAKEYPRCNFEEYRESRNPYFAKGMELQEKRPEQPTLLVDKFTERNKGRWREFFKKPKDAFLELELGAYHGETSVHLARTNPEHVCVGIEWKYKQAYRAGKRALDFGLNNLCIMRANIARITWAFDVGEIDRVWILFPDPWSVESQRKHRLLQPQFFKTLAGLLSDGKEVMIKTDHTEYAEFICAAIKEAGGFGPMNESRAEELWQKIPPTYFERIFVKQGAVINKIALVRKAV